MRTRLTARVAYISHRQWKRGACLQNLVVGSTDLRLKTNALRCADNITVPIESEEVLEELLQVLQKVYNMKISRKKTR